MSFLLPCLQFILLFSWFPSIYLFICVLIVFFPDSVTYEYVSSPHNMEITLCALGHNIRDRFIMSHPFFPKGAWLCSVPTLFSDSLKHLCKQMFHTFISIASLNFPCPLQLILVIICFQYSSIQIINVQFLHHCLQYILQLHHWETQYSVYIRFHYNISSKKPQTI